MGTQSERNGENESGKREKLGQEYETNKLQISNAQRIKAGSSRELDSLKSRNDDLGSRSSLWVHLFQ